MRPCANAKLARDERRTAMPFEDKVYGSIAELVGSTPLVELHGL